MASAGDLGLVEELARVGGDGGLVAVASIFVTIGIFMFRILWHKDKVSGTNATATVDALKKLHDLLDYEKNKVDMLALQLQQAYERVEAISKERNDMIIEVGKLRSEIAELRIEVKMLRERYD